MRRLPRPVWWIGALGLVSCNRYDLFRVTGYEQQSFNNQADVLFVIDNSDSMLQESESLAVNFASFIQEIDAQQSSVTYDGLADAVSNYVGYVRDRSSLVDYRFSITTTDVPFQAGLLVGPTVSRGEPDVPGAFIQNLACEATCFGEATALPNDDAYVCGDPLGAFLSEEYMQCACANGYRGNCGSAVEEGLEAVFLAMCRAVPNPPVECFGDVDNGEEQFPALLTESDVLTNDGMMRDGANLVVVVVSDEGDKSRRLLGEDIPEEYVSLFAKFRKRMTWVYVGPRLDEEDQVACPGTASDYGVLRYNYLAYTTDGRAIDIYDESCNEQDFAGPLGELGDLLTNLVTSFPLQSVPVPGSVLVLVDGESLPQSTVTGIDRFGLDLYSDGWTYRAADNAVVFHGGAIPTYDANVEVYYQPVDGMPRDLPF